MTNQESFEQIMNEPLRSCSFCGEPEFVFGVELNEESECPKCAAALRESLEGKEKE